MFEKGSPAVNGSGPAKHAKSKGRSALARDDLDRIATVKGGGPAKHAKNAKFKGRSEVARDSRMGNHEIHERHEIGGKVARKRAPTGGGRFRGGAGSPSRLGFWERRRRLSRSGRTQGATLRGIRSDVGTHLVCVRPGRWVNDCARARLSRGGRARGATLRGNEGDGSRARSRARRDPTS